jgi:hypothetical protein
VSVRPIGFGEGKFGAGRFGGPPQVIVELESDDFEFIEEIIDAALGFLEAEMTRSGL